MMKGIDLLQRELGQIFLTDLGSSARPTMLGILDVVAERQLMDEWKEEFDHLTLPELSEVRESIARKLVEAKRQQLEAETPVTPIYIYYPGLQLRAIEELEGTKFSRWNVIRGIVGRGRR